MSPTGKMQTEIKPEEKHACTLAVSKLKSENGPTILKDEGAKLKI